MAHSSIESCSDAVILRSTRLEGGKTYHIRYSVLEDLPDRTIIGRYAFAQIGRYDLLAVAEKSNAPKEARKGKSSSVRGTERSKTEIFRRLLWPSL
jgi:hypothetical protein